MSPFLLACLFLLMALVGVMMVGYVAATSITNYQAASATGKALAVLSASMATFGMIGMGFVLLRYSSVLTSNLKLLLGIGVLFSAFDIAAGAAILAT